MERLEKLSKSRKLGKSEQPGENLKICGPSVVADLAE